MKVAIDHMSVADVAAGAAPSPASDAGGIPARANRHWMTVAASVFAVETSANLATPAGAAA